MDNRLLRNPLIPPILIGSASLLGICLILAFAWIPRPGPEVSPTHTRKPFKYLLLATEPAIPFSAPETAIPTEILSTPTISSGQETTILPVGTEQTAIPADGVLLPQPTSTLNPKFAGTISMTAGTYDAGNSQIIRKGNWVIQENEGAFEGSLLVSSKAGNSVAFRFDGYRMSLGFQGSDTSGEITVDIDGSEETFTQEMGMEWFSKELEPGTHFVTLTHETGSIVNLDYIVIIE